MKSPSTSRISVSGLRDDVLEALDDLADAEDKNRSEKIVELIEAEVADRLPDDSGEYEPTDNRLAAVYRAAVDAANRNLILRFDLHGAQIASTTGIGQKAVRGHLFRLQRRGYVKHLYGDGHANQTKESYRVKPLCADPRMWRFSEVYDRDAVAALHADSPEETMGTIQNMEKGAVD